MKTYNLKNHRKYPLTKKKKLLCLGAGLLLLLSSAAAGFHMIQPKTETVEQTDYSYSLSSDIHYRVKLLPNDLFGEEWQDEGLLYSSALTDEIEVSFHALFAGSQTAPVTADYHITGIIEGYQDTKDVRRIIYQRNFPLREGSVPEGQGSSEINDTLSIELAPYKEAADRADAILGATPSRQFYLRFEGNFQADTSYGEVTEPFSINLKIPLESSSGLYEIPVPSPVSHNGALTSSIQVTHPAGFEQILPVAMACILSLACILWALWGTRLPSEEESYRLLAHSLIRKHGSRMVRLNQLDRYALTSSIQVSDMDNLILISEEIHRPVYYCPDADNLPVDGIFYVTDTQTCYTYLLKTPYTTLVPSRKEKEGISGD